ncbi:ABC transporter ATP-binding protein [Bacillus sp. ISL-47]|uniref:ABC transporter ATP-binding protein n=1 Tax=Bacillus sp. ISL-47 TaxID=2819130 RepID=UPI001BE855B5|nr:ABC transporter ATP-binding protein [Bacillus sp. ISL-47]MBT2690505.1 ABC transporter ATP-binding protein [Bacillus sp. ISL-47]MBT2709413.1 ABC transporter ATP-binding protein [Pseudomonas sp. ISL-84]
MNLLNVDIASAGYENENSIIHNIHFELKKGELIGLIGPNGAGKSTTIKTILGLLEHKKGLVDFKEGANYSYIPERPIFYDELTLWEHLDFAAAVEGLPEKEFKNRAAGLLEQYKLSEHAHKFPGTYSKGMQQKAMLILAMIANPDVYIIDEPFIGLDPNAMKLFLESIVKERRRGAGILMSTHVLDTAEKVCSRFLILHEGQLKASGTLSEIRQQCSLPSGSLYDCFHQIAEGAGNEER